jgi:hypothetical protein
MRLAQFIDYKTFHIPTDFVGTIDLNDPNLTFGKIINALLPYIFVFAGLGLLIYLLYSGFHFMISVGDPKAMQEAKGKITNALVGFIIVFMAYWLVLIIGRILGIQTFGGIF